MINSITARVLSNRLPLALIHLSPDIVEMLDYKWGTHDGMFHSVKATIKKFNKFKDIDVIKYENQALDMIDEIITGIYRCPGCRNDLRKCGIIRRTYGTEIVELYIAEDGKQSRTNHEKFESDGEITYQCLACHHNIQEKYSVYSFLRNGINKDVCIDYLYRFHQGAVKRALNGEKLAQFQPNIVDTDIHFNGIRILQNELIRNDAQIREANRVVDIETELDN